MMHALEILRCLCNLKTPEVRVSVKDPETGKAKSVVDPEATQAARDKAEEIREEWQTWITRDPERTKVVHEAYCLKFSGFTRRRWSGDYLSFPGLSLTKPDGTPLEPRLHQRTEPVPVPHEDEQHDSACQRQGDHAGDAPSGPVPCRW